MKEKVINTVSDLVVYVILLAVLMIVNTVFFNLGDPKFEGGAWLFYTQIWGLVYLPFILSSIIFSYFLKKNVIKFLSLSLVILLVIIEISFLRDSGIIALVIEFLIFLAILFGLWKYLKK